jgi:murein L,D-transpeptidase YafK
MSLPLLLSAAAALLASPADTTRGAFSIVMPTVTTRPVTGIRGRFTADSIVVEKSLRTMTLYQAGFPIRTYGIALGKEPKGDKVKQGDGRTPEGLFYIDSRNPASKYHRSLHISYPDAAHARRANELGVAAGGDVMIHGLPKGYEKFGAQHREWDWTEGCVAVTNEEIEEIWSAIPDGTPIQIKP